MRTSKLRMAMSDALCMAFFVTFIDKYYKIQSFTYKILAIARFTFPTTLKSWLTLAMRQKEVVPINFLGL